MAIAFYRMGKTNLDHVLAIVLPAYKGAFLRASLQSICEQDDPDFNVYIGDDASPEDLEAIVREFEGRLNLVYHRFPDNLGGRSLVSQWSRCIAMVGREDWIWLFSDDDIMEPGCVRAFYRELAGGEGPADAYRFDTVKIDESGAHLQYNHFPQQLDTRTFLDIKLSGQAESYMQEYIFRKACYLELGGFPDFPLGWAADDAFLLSFLARAPVRTIAGPRVHWRYSQANISGHSSSSETALLKIAACLQFLRWLKKNTTAGQHRWGRRLAVNWYSMQLSWLGRHLSFVRILGLFARCLGCYPIEGFPALILFAFSRLRKRCTNEY
jgi:glycosyltransferase involved in cell wall biosynthesis